jgi:hypothetical protein
VVLTDQLRERGPPRCSRLRIGDLRLEPRNPILEHRLGQPEHRLRPRGEVSHK